MTICNELISRCKQEKDMKSLRELAQNDMEPSKRLIISWKIKRRHALKIEKLNKLSNSMKKENTNNGFKKYTK